MNEEYITLEEEQEYLAYHTYQDVLNNYESALHSLKEYNPDSCKNIETLICGAMVAFDKGLTHFLNTIYDSNPKTFLLSEVTAQYRRYTKEKVKMPHICTPHLLAKEILIVGMDIPTTEEMQYLCNRKKYVEEAITNLQLRHPNMGDGYGIAWGYYAYTYIFELIQKLNPKRVILWNEFYAFHIIFRGICKDMRIPVSYMEFGCIPGTICIEEQGQQGESIPSREFKKFRYKWIDIKEYNNSYEVLEYLKHSGLNRNIQPDNKISSDILKYYKASRKTITYFGQNDFESGMVPYTNQTYEFHSPIFQSSLECLEYLSLLAIKNDWNLIFKPHPIMVALGHDNIDVEHDIISNIDINSIIDFSDLIITILSQSAYISLIREKPVLMLGYTQLRGKKCIYEAFKKSNIEKQVSKAIKYGYTIKQKIAFRKHVAQLFKYYLYDDLTHEYYPFGKKIEDEVV